LQGDPSPGSDFFRAAILNGNLELALEVERDWARLMREGENTAA